ncbi:glutamate receptor ionotropic, kainate 1-like isoform X2 [Oscarella lobularis]|uniref:glutamate receptor ionotropic, kainate 1-like isoform X2 n=1 Tax=Oscarella lobularis TaxID=121494 RepID=UPI0033134EF2
MSSNLVVLLFLLQSFEGIFADAAHAVFSDSYIKAVVKSVQAIHPNATNVSVVANDCSEVETKNAVHLTPQCLLGSPSRPTLPALAFKHSSLVVGMGHAIESQLNVARAIAARYDWKRLELWTEDVDDSLPRRPDLGLFAIRHLYVDGAQGERRSASDAIVVHCSTATCFNALREVLSDWSGSNVWIFTEDVTKKFLFRGSLRRLLPSGAKAFGMIRSFSNGSAARREGLVDSACPLLTQCPEDMRETILPNAAYLHDAILLLSHLTEVHITPQRIRDEAEKLDFLATGGPIRLDKHLNGRIHDSYDIISLSSTFTPKAAVYSEGKLTSVFNENLDENKIRSKRDMKACPPAVKRNGTYHFRVVTVVEPPFLFHNPNATPQFTGFVIDMLEKLKSSDSIRFTYELMLNETYGDFLMTTSGLIDPTGMLGEIVHCRADLGVAAIGITANRQRYVDFTKPWMDYGLVLLTSKPHPLPASYFAFMNPFSSYTWLLILVFVAIASVALPVYQLIAPRRVQKEHDASRDVTIRRLPRKFYDSFWFFFTTAMQQGPDGAPFLPARILIGLWYFFVLIIVATYTANLAAFLTVQRLPAQISSVEELAAQVQTPYGTVANSGVQSFFKNSTIPIYQNMGKFMSSTPNFMVDSSLAGLARASVTSSILSNEYFFIWDLPVLQYLATKRPCKVQVVGRSFNRQGYGIVMPTEMPYRDRFSLEVLKLRDSGWIEATAANWLNAGECGAASAITDTGQVTVANLVGVFILMAVGIGLGFIAAVLQRVLVRRGSDNKEDKRRDPVCGCLKVWE